MPTINGQNLYRDPVTKEVSVFHHETNIGQVYDFNNGRWVEEATDRIITHPNFYVDIHNGNDTNDGKTTETSFRSFAKLSQLVYGAIVLNGELNIHIAGGNYPEVLYLKNFKGEINIYTYDAGHGADVYITPTLPVNQTTAVLFHNVERVSLAGNLVIEPKELTDFKYGIPLYFKGVGQFYIEESVIVSHAKVPGAVYAIVSDYSHGTISCKVDGAISAVQSSNHSQVTILGAYFTNCTELVVLSGGMLNKYSLKAGSQNLITNNTVNSGLEFQTVNNGIIIEEGRNANGGYTKFANGLLHIHHNLNIPVVSGKNSMIEWNFPLHSQYSETHGFIDIFANVKSSTVAIDPTVRAVPRYNPNNAGVSSHIQIFNPTTTQTINVSVFGIGRWK